MIYSLEGESPQPSLLPLRRVLPFTDGAISFLLWAFVGWVVFVGIVSAFRPHPIWVLRRSGALAMFARWLLNWCVCREGDWPSPSAVAPSHAAFPPSRRVPGRVCWSSRHPSSTNASA